jgi:DNA invertase Pin-like site-specific DNA recombinase
MKVGIYARVSTMDQNPENQAIELRRYAESRKWEIFEDRIFTDHGVGGRKGEDKRPALKEFMDAARRHRFNVVLVWEYSRIARSSMHLLELMNNFRLWNMDFVSIQQNVDTTTAMGRLVYTFLAGLAEYEVEQGRERTLLGLARARSEGKILGRPRVTITIETVKLRAMAPDRPSVRTLAKIFGVSKSWISNALSIKRGQKTASTVVGGSH